MGGYLIEIIHALLAEKHDIVICVLHADSDYITHGYEKRVPGQSAPISAAQAFEVGVALMADDILRKLCASLDLDFDEVAQDAAARGGLQTRADWN